jgi:hypothetical protein
MSDHDTKRCRNIRPQQCGPALNCKLYSTLNTIFCHFTHIVDVLNYESKYRNIEISKYRLILKKTYNPAQFAEVGLLHESPSIDEARRRPAELSQGSAVGCRKAVASPVRSYPLPLADASGMNDATCSH